MYDRASHTSAERPVLAGVFVATLVALYGAADREAYAQTYGKPNNVIVDESVLDQLGPPPQSLPSVILRRQPQTYRPVQRQQSGAPVSVPPVARAPLRQAPLQTRLQRQAAPQAGVLLPPPARFCKGSHFS